MGTVCYIAREVQELAFCSHLNHSVDIDNAYKQKVNCKMKSHFYTDSNVLC